MKQAKRKAGLNKANRISRLVTDTKSQTLYYTAGAPSAGAGNASTLGR